MNSKDLEYYCFVWSELRLLIAAGALFLGGLPPLYLLTPLSLYGLAKLILLLSWIISGLASGYLLYRWLEKGQRLFGKKDHTDAITFLILVISGINLGFAGMSGQNIGMSIFTGQLLYMITGIIYLYSAWHLWIKAKARGGKLF